MANIYSNYNYTSYRKNNSSDRIANNDDPRNKSLQRANQQIRYHNPLERLDRRLKFQNILKEKCSRSPDILKKDNFAIFDAVAKRGGYQQVCSKNRWQEINYSILYDKKNWGLNKYYEEVLLPLESQLLEALPFYSKSEIIEHQFIELHLLTPTNLTACYYQLTPAQYMFAEANYFSLDQYYNLKTIALFQPQISKISVQYADKFMMLRKRLLFTNQIKQAALKELKTFGITLNLQNKVFIIGLSLSSLIIADYLSQFGLHVIVFDKNKQEGKYREQNQIVQNGIVLLEGTKQQGSYYSYLANLNISLEDISGNCALLDEDGKPVSEEKVRTSQQHFMAILDQLKGEVMSKKKLNEEVMFRVVRKKLEHEKTLIRWHYDRYLLFNRIKGDNTTVGDLFTYETKRFVKHIVQPYAALTLRSCSKLYERVKAKKNVTVVSQQIQSNITYTNGVWNVYTRSDSYGGKYLIYSDHESLNRSVQEGNAKFEEIGSDVMGDSISILQQLTSLKYINCIYSFRDKVTLKDSLKGQNCFTVNTLHGYVYFFIVGGGYEVLAVLRCYPNSSINFFKELLAILESKCLAKSNNKMVGEENWAYEYSFSLKDQKYIETLIRIKPIEKMYVMLPMTSTNCPYRVQSQIDMTNYICALILEEIYPDYNHYDPHFKKSFQQEATNQPQFEKKSLSVQMSVQNETPRKIGNRSERMLGEKNQEAMSVSLSRHSSSKKDKISQMVAEPIKTVNTQSKLFALSEDIDDTFGFSHPLVKKYQEQAKNKYSSNSKPFTSVIQTNQPIMLSENMTLFSFGQPYINEEEWFVRALAEKQMLKERVNFYALNRLVTRREEVSIRNSLRMTTYYQTALVINGIIFYCIIDENDPQVLYFHNCLNVLLVKFNEIIRKSKKDQTNSDLSSKNKKPYYPSTCLTSSFISEQIQAQIAKLAEPLNLDSLLDQKLTKAIANQEKKFMGGQLQVLHTSHAPFSDTILMTQLFDFYTNIEIVLKETQSYFDAFFRIAEIKPFKLVDLFFGILDEQFICCQIMKKFQEKSLTYLEIQSSDAQLCQQIREVFTRSVTNELYSLYIMPEVGCITMNRNFMHRKRQNDFEQYSYIFARTSEGTKHHLIMDRHKIEFKSKDQIINYIIRCLVVKHNNYDIIKNMQQLLHRDIQRSNKLAPKLKLYYLMTKKQIQRPVTPASLDKFNEKCKQLNAHEKMMMSDLMVQKKIRWVQNDFIFVVK